MAEQGYEGSAGVFLLFFFKNLEEKVIYQASATLYIAVLLKYSRSVRNIVSCTVNIPKIRTCAMHMFVHTLFMQGSPAFQWFDMNHFAIVTLALSEAKSVVTLPFCAAPALIVLRQINFLKKEQN
jgi:hypothetical protein